MRNIYARVNAINDKSNALEANIGNPHYRATVIRHYFLDAIGFEVFEDTLITPTPKVTNVSPRLIDITLRSSDVANNVTVSALDKQAEISRSYNREFFVRKDARRSRVFVDVPTEDGAIKYNDIDRGLSGSEMIILHLDDRDCCFWRLILRSVADA